MKTSNLLEKELYSFPEDLPPYQIVPHLPEYKDKKIISVEKFKEYWEKRVLKIVLGGHSGSGKTHLLRAILKNANPEEMMGLDIDFLIKTVFDNQPNESGEKESILAKTLSNTIMYSDIPESIKNIAFGLVVEQPNFQTNSTAKEKLTVVEQAILKAKFRSPDKGTRGKIIKGEEFPPALQQKIKINLFNNIRDLRLDDNLCGLTLATIVDPKAANLCDKLEGGLSVNAVSQEPVLGSGAKIIMAAFPGSDVCQEKSVIDFVNNHALRVHLILDNEEMQEAAEKQMAIKPVNDLGKGYRFIRLARSYIIDVKTGIAHIGINFLEYKNIKSPGEFRLLLLEKIMEAHSSSYQVPANFNTIEEPVQKEAVSA
jgi:GTPase SAR1 family protein